MSTDPYARSADTVMAPASRCFPILPSDSASLPTATKAIYIGKGGDVTLRSLNGAADVTFRAVPGGSILDVRVTAIRATGTSAADIVGLA